MSRIDRQLARFLTVGVGSNLLNFFVYYLAYTAGATLMVASVLGYLAGLLNSYHMGRVWVFDVRVNTARTTLIRFVMIYAIGGVGMSVIIEFLDRAMSWDYRLCWFLGALFAFVNNFFGSKLFVFKEGGIEMATQFGFLSKLEFLQDWASALIAGINPAVVHNLEKYHTLKKVHYLSAIENIEGDYLEFGVFMGSSFCHSLRCYRKLAKFNLTVRNTRFFGFDSFLGFGALSEDDKHPFYIDKNFATSLRQVDKRVRRVARGITYKLIPGFFSDSLVTGPNSYGIEKSKIIFIDSDTYSSASEALTFCLPTVQEGTFIVLDDYYSYRGSEERGVARAFAEFMQQGCFKARQVFTYGMGGVVYVISVVAA